MTKKTILPLTENQRKVLDELKTLIRGELHTSDFYRYLFSTDASYHLIVPVGVCYPKDSEDIQKIVSYLHKHNSGAGPEQRIPIVMRSGGTSVTGSPIGSGLVIDCTKYLNRIVDINGTKRIATAEPGVVYDEFNEKLKPYNLFFGPDPSSGNACEMGGMAACNAAGNHHVRYGAMRENVISVNAVLYDGTEIETRPYNIKNEEFQRLISSDTTYGRICSQVYELVKANSEILKKFKMNVVKNSSGYDLSDVLKGETFDLAKLLIGSEGTLAIFTGLKVRLEPILKNKAVALALFSDWESASKAVLKILTIKPFAVELADRSLIDTAKRFDSEISKIIPENPEVVLLIEFYSDKEGFVEYKLKQLSSILGRLPSRIILASSSEHQAKLWTIRKMAGPIENRLHGDFKAIPFVEDCSVHPLNLAEFINGVKNIGRECGVEFVFYGHAADGNIHIRPRLNLKTVGDIKKMETIAGKTFGLIDRLQGSYSGEHGDGYTRANYVRQRFGQLYGLFVETKKIFDPLNMLNPGKKIPSKESQLLSDLRFGEEYTIASAENNASNSQKAVEEMERCIGLSVCKGFCPSYFATMDEKHLSRGRSNAFRGLVSGVFGEPDRVMLTEEFREMIDTCLLCHTCSLDCPALVDVSRFILDAKRYIVKKKGMPLIEHLFSNYDSVAKMGCLFVPLTNWLMKKRILRKMGEITIGMDSKRILPDFSRMTLRQYLKKRNGLKSQKRVAYFTGCYANFNNPSVGITAVEILEKLGYEVIVPEQRCDQIAKNSYGGDFRRNARFNIKSLYAVLKDVEAIVTTCSSCSSGLRKVYPEELQTEEARIVASRTLNFTDFIYGLMKNGKLKLKKIDKKCTYHMGCHMNLQCSTNTDIPNPSIDPNKLFSQITDFTRMKRRCCGMGGTFGLKKKNRFISDANGKELAHNIWLTKADCVITECPGCTMMIKQQSERKVVHPVEIIKEAVD